MRHIGFAWGWVFWVLALGPAMAQVAPEAPALRAGWREEYARPVVIYPDDDPFSRAKAKLGEILFFDPVLSGARTMACATCHIPAMAWADHRAKSVGESGLGMPVRSPTLLNVAWAARLGWDGKFPTLESVAFRAISAETNMNLSEAEALRRLQGSPAYVRLFEASFGTGRVTAKSVEQALATFERGLQSGPAPFDRWVAGDETAVSAPAKRGFALFDGGAGCSACHSGWTFSDHSFQDIGSATGADWGRGILFPSSVALRYAFKVPSLRDAVIRAPFMHDGSRKSLISVIDLYDRGGIDRPSRSSLIHPLHLSAGDKADLISFLATLTSDRRDFTAPLLPH